MAKKKSVDGGGRGIGSKTPAKAMKGHAENNGVAGGHISNGRKKASAKKKAAKKNPAEALTESLTKMGVMIGGIGFDMQRGSVINAMNLELKLTVKLIGTDNGWRVKAELPMWLLMEFEKAGYNLAERKNPTKQHDPIEGMMRESRKAATLKIAELGGTVGNG